MIYSPAPDGCRRRTVFLVFLPPKEMGCTRFQLCRTRYRDLIHVLTSIQGKRIFIKDITHYLVPPEGRPASLAPSLCSVKRGVGTSNSTTTNGSALKVTSSPVNDAFAVDEDSNVNGEKYPYPTLVEPGNPTVIPQKILEQFHFAFLIRHPKHSIPSYWRCTIPPLDEVTGFYNFMPAEAGYDEQRRVFDYLRSIDQIGPEIAADQGTSRVNGHSHDETKVKICVIDADEMLENPRVIMRKFCESVGIDFDPGMLEWDTPEDHTCAREAFEKWKGFHEDAINSSGLHARDHVSSPIMTSRPDTLLMGSETEETRDDTRARL